MSRSVLLAACCTNESSNSGWAPSAVSGCLSLQSHLHGIIRSTQLVDLEGFPSCGLHSAGILTLLSAESPPC